MIKLCTASEYELGFILDLSSNNNIIIARTLLITPYTDACINIISTPLPEDRRIISIPEWKISFVLESSCFYSQDFTFTCKNDYIAPYKQLLSITVDVIHRLIDSGVPDEVIMCNDITDAGDFYDFPFENQSLPF